MAYNAFAYWYDSLNEDADYTRLFKEVDARLKKHGASRGTVADLGCGTGELTLRLGAARYDMIAVDSSPEMLSVLREKQADWGGGNILLLCQSLDALDLYGTITGAVSTFDTFNHLPKDMLKAALQRVGLFTEPGGVLIFDVNTLYKHEQVLGNNIFEAEPEGRPGALLEWENRFDPASRSTSITVTLWDGDEAAFSESFTEYSYTLAELDAMLEGAGFEITETVDGETFAQPFPASERLMITAIKR